MSDDERMHFRVEQSPFVMVPRWLLFSEVSDGAVRTYCNLHDLVAGREGPTRPLTRGELAEKRGVSANTIDRHLTELIEVGAVEKQACIPSGGQVGNVYRVWLTHPRQRSAGGANGVAVERVPKNGEAVQNPVDNRVPKNGEAPHGWGPPVPKNGDPTAFKEEKQEIPPQPPRRAGGLTNASLNGNGNGNPAGPGGRRADGTNLRSVGANPRAEGEAIAAERERERVAVLAAEADRKETERRVVEAAAEAEAQAAGAERLALAAALDDETLALVVERVSTGLVGPLARSPLAVSREVVRWCRMAVARQPGPFGAAVTAALADEWPGAGDDESLAASPLDLPAPGPDTPRLQDRIRTLNEALDTQLAAAAAP